jgi:hypothetical protein
MSGNIGGYVTGGLETIGGGVLSYFGMPEVGVPMMMNGIGQLANGGKSGGGGGLGGLGGQSGGQSGGQGGAAGPLSAGDLATQLGKNMSDVKGNQRPPNNLLPSPPQFNTPPPMTPMPQPQPQPLHQSNPQQDPRMLQQLLQAFGMQQ